MASITELEENVRSLESFHKSLGEEIERIKEIYNPKLRSSLIKKIYAQIIEFAMKMPHGKIKTH